MGWEQFCGVLGDGRQFGRKTQFAPNFALLERWMNLGRFALASVRPDDAAFEAQRYWRGPVWPHLNWMIAEGCAHYGRHDLSDRLRADTRALIEDKGFYEYFNPLTGEAYGAPAFSWSAAVILHWVLAACRT